TPLIDPTTRSRVVLPALTHLSMDGTYCSAFCLAVVPLICTVSTLPLGSRVQVSSSQVPFLVCVPWGSKPSPASAQLCRIGSQMAVRESHGPPKSTRPSASTMAGASPETKSNSGDGLSMGDHRLVRGSKTSPRAQRSWPNPVAHSPPTA